VAKKPGWSVWLGLAPRSSSASRVSARAGRGVIIGEKAVREL
jgi:hypothetical protein